MNYIQITKNPENCISDNNISLTIRVLVKMSSICPIVIGTVLTLIILFCLMLFYDTNTNKHFNKDAWWGHKINLRISNDSTLNDHNLERFWKTTINTSCQLPLLMQTGNVAGERGGVWYATKIPTRNWIMDVAVLSTAILKTFYINISHKSVLVELLCWLNGK